MLDILLSSILAPLKSALAGIMTNLGSAFAGLLGGQGAGGFGNIFKGIGGAGISAGMAALFGGGTAAAGTGAAAAGVSLDAALAGGTASGGFFGSLGAFMTNPWTIGVAGAAALGYLGYRLAKGQTTWGAGAKEAARDMGGIDIGSDVVKDYISSVGLDPEKAWGVRKDMLFSPQFLAYAYSAAVNQGKAGDFLQSLENISVDPKMGGSANFRAQFEDFIKTGNATAINQSYMDVFGKSEALKALMPDYSSLLISGTNVSGIPGGVNITVNITGTVMGENVGQIVEDAIQESIAKGGLSNINNANIGTAP